MKKIIYTISLLCTAYKLSAQVGINTTQPTTTLDIKATNETTGRIPGAYSSQDGILVPRVNSIGTTQGVAEGQLIYLTATETVGSITRDPGFYYWVAPQWNRIGNFTLLNSWNNYPAVSSSGNNNVSGTTSVNPGATIGTASYIGTSNNERLIMGTHSTAQLILQPDGSLIGGGNGANLAWGTASFSSPTGSIPVSAAFTDGVSVGTDAIALGSYNSTRKALGKNSIALNGVATEDNAMAIAQTVVKAKDAIGILGMAGTINPGSDRSILIFGGKIDNAPDVLSIDGVIQNSTRTIAINKEYSSTTITNSNHSVFLGDLSRTGENNTFALKSSVLNTYSATGGVPRIFIGANDHVSSPNDESLEIDKTMNFVIGNTTATCGNTKAGVIRYTETSGNGHFQVCAQTATSTYAWKQMD